MRCKNCKKIIPFSSKFCPSCGTGVSAEQKKKRKRGCLVSLIIILILFVGQAVYYIFGASSDLKTIKALSEIQSNLTDIASAKLAGNSVDAGEKVTTAYQNIANLSVPSLLQDYQQVAVIWANKISASTNNAKTWKNLSNQPGDFPLILNDNQAQTFFQSSIKTIAELKQNGIDAIKNKDKEAVRLVAAKLLVQKHWLNGILYSKNSRVAFLNIVTSVFAANQDPLQVPNIDTSEDVTCRLCSDPGIHWTAKLRNQYGCDTRCKPQQKQDDQNKNNSNNNPVDNISKLESFTYKSSPKRAICIGNNIGGVFCVEDAVQSVNEIAASAIGFADGTKILSVNQWNNEYKNIDDAFLADGTVGAPVSSPTAAGGHLEGGMGTITNDEQNSYPPPPPPPPVLPPLQSFPLPPGAIAPPVDLERDTSAQQTNR